MGSSYHNAPGGRYEALKRDLRALRADESIVDSWKFEDGQESEAFVDGFEHAIGKVEALLFGQPAPGLQEAGRGASPATMVSSVPASAPALAGVFDPSARTGSEGETGEPSPPERVFERSNGAQIVDLMEVIKRNLGMT